MPITNAIIMLEVTALKPILLREIHTVYSVVDELSYALKLCPTRKKKSTF